MNRVLRQAARMKLTFDQLLIHGEHTPGRAEMVSNPRWRGVTTATDDVCNDECLVGLQDIRYTSRSDTVPPLWLTTHPTASEESKTGDAGIETEDLPCGISFSLRSSLTGGSPVGPWVCRVALEELRIVAVVYPALKSLHAGLGWSNSVVSCETS